MYKIYYSFSSKQIFWTIKSIFVAFLQKQDFFRLSSSSLRRGAHLGQLGVASLPDETEDDDADDNDDGKNDDDDGYGDL